MGSCCGSCESRVNDDKLCTLVQRHRERLSFVAVRIADDHIVAPDHDAFGVVFVIHYGIGTACDDAGGDTWAVTEVAGCQGAGTAEQVGEPVDYCLILSARSVSEDDGLGAVESLCSAACVRQLCPRLHPKLSVPIFRFPSDLSLSPDM